MPELVCPAGTAAAAEAAIDHGADAVYVGLRNETNARNFPGLNLTPAELATSARYAHRQGRKIYLALNTYAQPGRVAMWRQTADHAASAGVDAIIAADMAVLRYCQERHPSVPRHLSVQGSATNTEALRFYAENFGVVRAILPRVLALNQVQKISRDTPVDLEVFGFGGLCVMVEGRCALSSYATGVSPNTCGACSPASAVRWEEERDQRRVRLNGILIDVFKKTEKAGYPTICKGRFKVEDNVTYALEEPTSLNVLPILDELARIPVRAIKIEGRQRSPAYVARVTAIMRAAIDAYSQNPDGFVVRPEWMQGLSSLSEGHQQTLGAFHRPWR
ncbi:MAG: ubiquinone anaerobic biosynthesis protein UbiU [Acidiferrobacter sp.]